MVAGSLALLAGADFLARGLAARAVARGLSPLLAARSASASIGGWAFLPRFLGGRIPGVVFSAEEAVPGGLPLDSLRLRAEEVRFSPWQALAALGGGEVRLEVGRVEAEGVLGEAAVSRLVAEALPGSAVSLGQGRAELEVALDLAGRRTALRAELALRVRGGLLEVLPVGLSGPLPPGSEAALAELLTIRIALPPLPGGLSWERVEVRPGSLVFGLTARDLALTVSRQGLKVWSGP